MLVWTGRTGANTAGGFAAGTEGEVKLLEFETFVLGAEDMNENGCVAGVVVSSDENLSLRLTLTAGVVATLWGVGAAGATVNGLVEGLAKENAERAEGVSETGLEAKEKLGTPEPLTVDALSEKAEGADVAHVEGTENVKPEDDRGATGTLLKGAAEGTTGAGAEGGNAAGADGIDGAFWNVVAEPSFGNLSPSKDKDVEGDTNCFIPGLKLSRANGQSNPCVDSSSITGAGGKVFSSDMRISCWFVKSIAKPSGKVSSLVSVTGSSALLESSRIHNSQFLSSCLAIGLTSRAAAEAAKNRSQSSIWLRK